MLLLIEIKSLINVCINQKNENNPCTHRYRVKIKDTCNSFIIVKVCPVGRTRDLQKTPCIVYCSPLLRQSGNTPFVSQRCHGTGNFRIMIYNFSSRSFLATLEHGLS